MNKCVPVISLINVHSVFQFACKALEIIPWMNTFLQVLHLVWKNFCRYGVFKKHKGVRAEIGQVNRLEICGGRGLYVFTCVRPEFNIKCLSLLLSALFFETESLNLLTIWLGIFCPCPLPQNCTAVPLNFPRCWRSKFQYSCLNSRQEFDKMNALSSSKSRYLRNMPEPSNCLAQTHSLIGFLKFYCHWKW